jgi:endonuclease/exonuclease/phosphatase family metal-dependent hydrolase
MWRTVRLVLGFGLMGLVGCGAVGPGLQAHGAAQYAARDTGVTLKLLSYNTFGLPAPLGKELKKRFAAIPHAIDGFDVVGLQETFTGESQQILDSGVYPHAFRQGRTKFYYPQSCGLTVLSKHAMAAPSFRPYRKCATSDCLAEKGILFTRIDVPQIGPVDVYDTHLQAHEPYELTRIEQIKDLVAFVKENDLGNPTFLLGDFNMHEDEDAYGHLQEGLAPVDAYRKANPDGDGFTSGPENPWGSGKGSPERIDYVFYLPGKAVDVSIVESSVVLKDKPLSDHYGIAATVKLTPKAARTR